MRIKHTFVISLFIFNLLFQSHATPEFPPTGVITEVAHLISNRTLYFQLARNILSNKKGKKKYLAFLK